MRTGDRVQGSGFRSQNGNSRPGRWAALVAIVLAGGCAAPKAQFTDADWVSHATTGRGCYERGDYRRGADAYGRAQERARALDDADALAVAAANRAVCLLAGGDATGARAAVEEALADGRVSAVRRAELQVAGARARLALGEAEEAVAMAGAALEGHPVAGVRAQAALVRGAEALMREDSAAAGKALAEGLSVQEWARQPATIRAERAAQLGEAAALEKRYAEAVERHEEAAALWKQAGRLPEMARAVAEAGRSAQGTGDLAGACERYYRAARSLWAQHLRAEALQRLEEGVSCVELVEDDEMAKKLTERMVTFQSGQRLSE